MSIRIFHISDFHLNKSKLSDWNDYQKQSFVSFVNENKATENFIVCSGDLVDKGGFDFGGIKAGLLKFKEAIIGPIVELTGIPIDRFIIAPGNHDIDRDADDIYTRNGLRGQIKENGIKEINNCVNNLLSTKGTPSKRVGCFYEFLEELYSKCDNIRNFYLGTVFNYTLADKKVSFTAFNTVWNCCDDRDKEFGLAIGEPQYTKCNKLTENTVRIAVMHHPLDWLIFENNTIQPWIRKDYNLLLLGHIHENDSSMNLTPMGSLIVNISPSFTNEIRSDSKTYQNGFTVIDYDIDNNSFDFTFLIYDFKFRKYKVNNDYAENGKFQAKLSEIITDKLGYTISKTIKYIQEKRIPEINGSIIPLKAKAIRSFNEAFVMPPLKKNGSLSDKDYSLSSILQSNSNILLFGQHESGKTVLLNKILTEFIENVDSYGVIPVYYDFNEYPNQELDTIVKLYLDCNSDEANILIDNNKILLLVDNYSPSLSNKEKAKRLYNFCATNNIRIIATSHNDLIDSVPQSFIENNEIQFEFYFIHHFNSFNVKELITKWSPETGVYDRNQKIENLVNRFCSFSLPCTAMSVSLYLWSTENSKRDPVNPSVLMDIYMEIILERMSSDNIYVNTFDYENKTSLLAFIAQSIFDARQDNGGKFNLTYGNYFTRIEDYLKIVGFKGIKSQELAEYFIKRKVLIVKENSVEFAHTCFYYFFLAKRMVKDAVFKNSILTDDNYFKNDRIIEYYSGLVRSDKALLEFLHKQFEKVFKEVEFVYNEVDVDKSFTIIRKRQRGYTPLIQMMNAQKIIDDKPSEEENEKEILSIADKKLSEISEKFNDVERISPEALLLLLSRALRNLDGIEDTELKQKVYNSIIKNSIILSVIRKDQFANYANTHGGTLPPSLGTIKNLDVFFRFMPFNLQANLGEILATRKLLVFFENKFDLDIKNKTSDIEKYFSIGMMWDTTGLDNKKQLKILINKIGKNTSQDYILIKLLYYFDYKVALGSKDEDEYISLIAELRSKQKYLKFIEKSSFIKQLKQARAKRMASKGKKFN